MNVSIIIPCYNVEAYLRSCLESVWTQTHDDLEVICVDDGSSDGTQALLDQLAAEAPRPIKVIHQENAGASAARNKGIENASGDYFQFLDADDTLLPGKIARQVQLAAANGQPDLIVGSYRRQTEAGEVMFERTYSTPPAESPWLMLMRTNLGITSSNLMKADFFRSGGRWNTKLGSSQEYDLMFRILQRADSVLFDEETHTHILHRDSGSISQTNRGPNWVRYIQLRIRILDFLKESRPNIDRQPGYQILFDAIRSLYPYDKKKALEFYRKDIPKGFKPGVSGATGKSYLMLFGLLGFAGAERVREMFIG